MGVALRSSSRWVVSAVLGVNVVHFIPECCALHAGGFSGAPVFFLKKHLPLMDAAFGGPETVCTISSPAGGLRIPKAPDPAFIIRERPGSGGSQLWSGSCASAALQLNCLDQGVSF